MEAGSGGRFWPQASACSSEDVVSPVSSDGAPASMTALPRNPWLKQPLLFLVASRQVQHHSCNDRQATWGGSYAYYRAETLSGPCNVLSHTRLWSQSAVMWPHLAAGRAVEGFYLHDIRILMVIRFYIAKGRSSKWVQRDNWKSLSQNAWNVKSPSVPSLSKCDLRQAV